MPVEPWRFPWDQRPRHFWSDRMRFQIGFVYKMLKAVLLCDLKDFPIQLGANPRSHGAVVKMLAKIPRQLAKRKIQE
jgi:hypothetical protein